MIFYNLTEVNKVFQMEMLSYVWFDKCYLLDLMFSQTVKKLSRCLYTDIVFRDLYKKG